MLRLRPVLFVNGLLLVAIAALMALVGLFDHAQAGAEVRAFMAAAVLTVFLGLLLIVTSFDKRPMVLSLKQAFLLTATSWIGLSLVCALPFLWATAEMSLADAVFESVSGFTTTGSTVMTGLDAQSPGLLMWRAILQGIGGIGIIVFAIIMLPFLRIGGMQLFHTESSDRSGKVVSKPGQQMTLIVVIYVGLTVSCALFYRLFGMTSFDAICHAMTTVSTGGFANYDASFGHFPSAAIMWTSVLFMVSGALPFVVYVRMIRGERGALMADPQVRGFLILLFVLIFAVAISLYRQDEYLSFVSAVRDAAFNVTSVVTTTGFASTDYTQWGSFAVVVFFVATFLGGCAGSTSGAVKIYRWQMLVLFGIKYMRGLTSPHRVIPGRYAGRPVTDDVATSVLAFIAAYIGSVAVLAVVLGGIGLDFETALTAAATAIGNVGPGLGPIIGPAGNFSSLPDSAKWVLAFGMLLGRLELFTLLILLDPQFWRR